MCWIEQQQTFLRMWSKFNDYGPHISHENTRGKERKTQKGTSPKAELQTWIVSNCQREIF